MKKELKPYHFFIPLLLLCAFYACKAIGFQIHDFANYYFGGKFLTHGSFDYKMYFPYEFNKAIYELWYRNIFASYAPNTPFLAVVFVPFSIVPVVIAKLIFNLISIGLLIFSSRRLFAFYKIDFKFALLIPVLFFIPIKNNLLFGQVYFLLFSLLAEGWLAYKEKRWKWMAFFWSVAILLKVFPILLLLPLIFKRRWKATLYLVASVAFLFGFSIIFTGIDVWIFYIKDVLPKASNGEIATAYVDNYQSVFMFLKRLFVYDSVENQGAFLHASDWFPAAVFAFKIGFVSLGYFISKNSKNSFNIISFWIMAMLLLSPYGSTYTLILLVFPFIALLRSEISDVRKGVLFGILFLVCNLPLSVFMKIIFPFSYLRLFFFIAFFAIFMILIFRKSATVKAIVIGCVVFAIGLFFEQYPIEKSKPLLKSASPILIYDYQIKDNQLTYSYWNDKGKNQASIPFRYSSATEMQMIDNQIATSNKKLTFEKSNKLKPILVDGKTIIYLSDYDRGIGFYTLRKMELK
jgi:hypothetical protein